jgi:hypothetical protein
MPTRAGSRSDLRIWLGVVLFVLRFLVVMWVDLDDVNLELRAVHFVDEPPLRVEA